MYKIGPNMEFCCRMAAKFNISSLYATPGMTKIKSNENLRRGFFRAVTFEEDDMGGWQGKILRVNLTDGTVTPEDLNQEWAQQYLGQRGLASKYLYEEMDPAVDPLSPENKMIIGTGPLTGTMASTGGRWSVTT